MNHEALDLAEAILAKLDSKSIPACMDELNFTDLCDLLSAPQTDYFVTVSPEEVQGQGHQCRSKKLLAIEIHIQVSGHSKNCKGAALVQELRDYLTFVRSVRDCVCSMGTCDLPEGFVLENPITFAEIPTDEDLSQFQLRFREIQFNFVVGVDPASM